MKKWQKELIDQVDNMAGRLSMLETDYRRDREAEATCDCGRWRYCRRKWAWLGYPALWFERGKEEGRVEVFCHNCNTLCRQDGSTISIPEAEATNE